MLELGDIQHILLTRVPALTGRYEFLSFHNATSGRAWLSAIAEKVQSAASVQTSVEQDKRWVTVAFRHIRIQNPQAPDTKKDHRLTGIYDRQGRRLFLPPGITALRHLSTLNAQV